MIKKDRTKPGSTWEVRRKIRVPALVHPADAMSVERALADVDGVLQVSADCTKCVIAARYLVTKTDYQALERILETVGFPPADSRWARFKSGWYQNLDLTGRENAGAPPPACCNKPPNRS